MRSWVRIVGVAVSVAAGVGAAAVTANAMRVRRATETPPSIARAAAMSAFDEERAVATALGMTLEHEGEAPVDRSGAIGGVWSQRVAFAAGDCVAVIATTFGNHSPVALALQGISDDETQIATGMTPPVSLTSADGGLVAQVQWCEASARPRTAVFETRAITDRVFERPLTATVHFAIYRGPWSVVGGLARLRRGSFGAWAVRQFPTRYALDESTPFVPAGGRMLGIALPMHVEGARLIPANAETYRAMYERVRGGSGPPVNPRIDASRPAGEPWGTGLPENLMELYRNLRGDQPGPLLHEPVFDAGGGRVRRVLAAVDTGRLGAHCVGLMFTRMLYLHRASMWRYGTAPGEVGRELVAQENSAIDRACPAQGVVVYAVDDHDQEDWLLRVYALPETRAEPVAQGVAPGAPETARDRRSRRRGGMRRERRHRRGRP